MNVYALHSDLLNGRAEITTARARTGLNKLIENSHAYSEPLLGFTALALAEALCARVIIPPIPPRAPPPVYRQCRSHRASYAPACLVRREGLTVTVIFPSAGTAAAAQASFKTALGRPVSGHVRTGAISAAVTRTLIAEGYDFTKCVRADEPSDVYLVAAPVNSRGDAVVMAVEQAVDKVSDADWCAAACHHRISATNLGCISRQGALQPGPRGYGLIVHLRHQDVERMPRIRRHLRTVLLLPRYLSAREAA